MSLQGICLYMVASVSCVALARERFQIISKTHFSFFIASFSTVHPLHSMLNMCPCFLEVFMHVQRTH